MHENHLQVRPSIRGVKVIVKGKSLAVLPDSHLVVAMHLLHKHAQLR